jgi:hypothetical protein
MFSVRISWVYQSFVRFLEDVHTVVVYTVLCSVDRGIISFLKLNSIAAREKRSERNDARYLYEEHHTVLYFASNNNIMSMMIIMKKLTKERYFTNFTRELSRYTFNCILSVREMNSRLIFCVLYNVSLLLLYYVLLVQRRSERKRKR